MNTSRQISLLSVCAGIVFAAGLSAPQARASDIEVFFSTPTTSSAKPNILFILDTSQSMFTKEPAAADPFDDTKDYDGACEDDKYYWTTGTDGTPDCGTGWAAIGEAEFACPNWKAAVDARGYETQSPVRVAQTDGTKWVGLTATPNQEPWKVACEGDSTDVPANWGAKNRGKPIFPSEAHTFYSGRWLNWFNDAGGEKYRIDIVREAVGRLITNTQGIKVGLMRYGYDGDRIFEEDPNTATACAVVQDGNEDSRSSNGAPVVFPVTDLDAAALPGFQGGTVREQIRYQLGVDANNQPLGWSVNASLDQADQPFQVVRGNGPDCGGNATIPLMTPGGRSPIGGAMMESYLYYAGMDWSLKYGKQADLGSGYSYPSVEQSRLGPDSDTYKSPIVDDCAKNFIILLSDGTTEQDNDVDGPIEKLPNFQQITGYKSCDVDIDPPTNDQYWADNGVDWTPPPSQCVDDAAELMFETDMDGDPDNGIQNVITYTIGFALGSDPLANAARTLLSQTATRGGGSFLEAGDAQELEEVIGQVVRSILTENTSFSAPAVTVNAFNRTQNLNDLYMALFRPAFNYRWYGNIKKYTLSPIDGDILDATGNPAVDPASGFFLKTSRSLWSPATDGDDVTEGGAASKSTAWSTRPFKTTAGDETVTDSGRRIVGGTMTNFASASLTDSDLGIQVGDYLVPAVSTSGALTADDLNAWFRGKDIGDENGNSITDETRQDMGDPLHAKPVTVVYGGTAASPNLNDAALFAVTNDGVLHAINPSTGVDLWTFVPRDQLGRIRDLYYNAKINDPENRGYGLDGNISVLRIDLNRNGIIETSVTQDINGDSDTTDFGEKEGVYLFMGQRRGGSKYLAMDVSDKNAPKQMWMSSYPLAGQAWSTPQPARVRIGTEYKWVLFFGGGYDISQDQQPYVADNVGRGLYMVDAETGALMWRAGPDGGADLQLTDMTNSSPADVRVIDLTGDGFDDRIYMADLGGRIWRFDIFNGKPVSAAEGDRLMEGGLLASLGNADQAAPRTQSNTIRFFYSPDPALITKPGPNYVNVAIGSGHREMPASDTTSVNWFFSVRDFNVYTQLRSSWYQDDCSTASTPCHETLDETDLVDLTNIVGPAAEAAVPVATASPGWKIQLGVSGEKALAESRTFQDAVYFTTYAPETITSVSVACGTAFGQNRLYVVSAQDARPINNFDAVVGESAADRSKKLAQGSIAPEVVFVFPTPPVDPNDPNALPPAVPPVCLVGLESCGFGLLNPPVRTYWWQHDSN